jgi:hypothetical protein
MRKNIHAVIACAWLAASMLNSAVADPSKTVPPLVVRDSIKVPAIEAFSLETKMARLPSNLNVRTTKDGRLGDRFTTLCPLLEL